MKNESEFVLQIQSSQIQTLFNNPGLSQLALLTVT